MVGQLGRPLVHTDDEAQRALSPPPDPCELSPIELAVELAEGEAAQGYSSTPTPAAAFRRCSLVAAGSFCTIGVEYASGGRGSDALSDDGGPPLAPGVELIDSHPRVVLALSRARG